MDNLWNSKSKSKTLKSLENRRNKFWNSIQQSIPQTNSNYVSYSSQMLYTNNGKDVKVYEQNNYKDSNNSYSRVEKSINDNFLEKIQTPKEKILNHNLDKYGLDNFVNNYNSFDNNYLPISDYFSINNYNNQLQIPFTVDNSKLDYLTNLGFNKEESFDVLKKTKNNLEKSLRKLIKKYKK